ncbi:helix-turn-helix domain-containing protein [Candidatus Electronema sp. PJ]|uniref:helix-turn-helix domain-containing protein n=1 Tax=Candidatus Electronema sp. PJ TaxID=3401572 RepID=UPI003AA8EA1B
MNQQEHSSTEKQAIVGGERQETRKTDNATVGTMLRQLRKEKGLSIRDVAKETNISASNLVAIEHENYADLPATTFIRGQVAIYANLLGIDGAEAAKKFIIEREHQQLLAQKNSKLNQESCTMSAKKLAEPAHVSAATLAVCILLLIALFITGFCLYTGWNPFSYLIQAPPPAAVQLSPAPELEAAVSAQQSTVIPTEQPAQTGN